MTPRPPFCAMAIAMRASVTVSIAEAMMGRLSATERVRRVRDVDVGRQHLGAARPQQHVIEGEAFDQLIGDDAGHGQLRALCRNGCKSRSRLGWRGFVACGRGRGKTFAAGSESSVGEEP